MPLFIRDPSVDALAEELRTLTKAKSKTEVVRRALQIQLTEARRALPLKDRLARSKALADSMGPSAPQFDIKAYTDSMWDGT